MGFKATRSHRTTSLSALAVSALLTLTACGGDDDATGRSAAPGQAGAESKGGLCANVQVRSIQPVTGPAAVYGEKINQGYELAVKHINDSRELGDSKLVLDKVDDGGDPTRGAQTMSEAVADKKVSVVLGDPLSSVAVVVAPVAEKGKLPIVFNEAGSDGVVLGDYTYRYTGLMPDYYTIIRDLVKQQGWKSLAILYPAGNPTLEKVAKDTLPALAAELGIKITKSVSTVATTQDFSAPISQLLSDRPDGVAILQIGAGNPTAMSQLRIAGYNGKVLGNQSASLNVLKPAGERGAGMVWPVPFSPLVEDPAVKAFSDAFKAEYGQLPSNYSAEAYDAMHLIADAVVAAKSCDREAVKGGLATVTSKPFSGVFGKDLTFKDNSLVLNRGVVVEWNGTEEKLLYSTTRK